MRKISKRNRKPEPVKKSVFLCKSVDPEFLGREIYADNVETPYNFYLIREMNLAKDYQNLAEGEAYFDAICDSWDVTKDFNKLVVKKIYMYVETEMMYYTLLMGSFEPLTRDARTGLKQWLAEVVVQKEERSLVYKGYENANPAELNTVLKQIMEASNEMFRLRKMIGELSETIGQARLEAKSQPVISRNIHTIHLKRAQPIIENNPESVPEEKAEKKPVTRVAEAPTVEGEYSEEDDVTIEIQHVTFEPDEQEETTEAEKKFKLGRARETAQGNTRSAEEDIISQEKAAKDNKNENESPTEKLRRKNQENQVLKTEDLKKASTAEQSGAEEIKPQLAEEEIRGQLLSKLILYQKDSRKRTPSNWPRFSRLMKNSCSVPAPKKIPNFSVSEMESLEDDIYLRFMNKRMNVLGKKKQRDQKRRVDQFELQQQISQAEYLNYSWGQVLKQRKEDILICNRLSSANLVAGMDDFLFEMKKIASKRSFFGRKVNCSVDKLRRLEGYVLMDQYMQKLSQISKEDYK
ncbi:hypothetical protein [Enterococcus sp. CWB-B31]|uniref:hypothetical protein n=1 Tax=Enterococcus sp. CWB-B31 TaxID=2885159 RepID=UPI001E43032F|nr:hypothetical protein [Enterococcus sp. CWB-B31]MCB5956303.1 hypothetical protein [Enterococcus sp. CWB-B31]